MMAVVIPHRQRSGVASGTWPEIRYLRGHSKCLDSCMVCAGDTIAPVGHRYQRVARH